MSSTQAAPIPVSAEEVASTIARTFARVRTAASQGWADEAHGYGTALASLLTLHQVLRQAEADRAAGTAGARAT
ncbi:hypothetical protein ACIPRL_08140 [Streptomyces sp. NPDC090085]|uniref:hypothetical protein n=1 Tax=Streptomyces sp. NPDC090085 TaxID=3365943 RepID=UPI0037FD19BE